MAYRVRRIVRLYEPLVGGEFTIYSVINISCRHLKEGIINATTFRNFGGSRTLVAGLLGTGFLAANIHTTSIRGGQSVRATSSNLPPYVTTIAQTLATRMGDATPSSASAVWTTRQAAVQTAMASQVDSNPPVYFVAIHGQFVDRYARIPPGQPFPTGTMIMFTIDTQTHTILDFGISEQAFDLSSLGTMIPLPRQWRSIGPVAMGQTGANTPQKLMD